MGARLVKTSDSGKIRTGLLEGGTESDLFVQLYAVCVALQTGIEIVVLSRPMVNAKTGPEYRLAVERARSPSQSDSGIKVPVIGIVQVRVGRAWRSISWTERWRDRKYIE